MNQAFNTTLKTKFDAQTILIDKAISKLPKNVAGYVGANSDIVSKLTDQYRIKYTLPTITVDLNEKRVENGIDNRLNVIYYLGYIGDGDYFKYKPEKKLYWSLGENILFTEKNIEITVHTHANVGEEITPFIMINLDNGIISIVKQIRNVLNQIGTEIDDFNYSLKEMIREKITNRI